MRIIQQIKDLLISICVRPLLGSISNSQARVAAKCQEAYQAIEATIKQSKVLHIATPHPANKAHGLVYVEMG